ncbi:MAG: 4Fe-4S dicluster domain-containing protein [Nitrososphaeria archaeon]
MESIFKTPFVKIKVGILRHSCEHNPSSGIRTCDPSELANFVNDLHSRAIVIVGIYDEYHRKLYREAALKAGINPLLMRVVDYRWGEQAIAQNVAILEHNWIADMAIEEEVALPVSRRELIKGSVKVGRDRVDKPVYVSDNCRSLYRACTLCQDSCPYGAISIDRKAGVNIDYNKCNACGLCVSSCPMSAVQFPSVSQQSIYDLARIKGKKVISCYKDSENSIKLPCIASLSAEDLLVLRASGEVVLKCPGCELEKNLDTIRNTVNVINSLIGGVSIDIRNNHEAPAPVSEFTLNTLNLTRHAEVRERVTDKRVGSLLLYDISVDSNCTMCESCAKWCPTSALKVEYDAEKSALTFDPASCIGCKICVNVCPAPGVSGEKAISAKKGQSNKKVLVEDYMVKCRVCGAPVGSRKSLDHVKELMESKGMQVDDDWLELCQKHRSEYAFKKMLGMNAQFRPRGASNGD